MAENTHAVTVMDENGKPGNAHMVLDRNSDEAGVNFKLFLQNDNQAMHSTVPIAFSFVVTGDEDGFAVSSDWLDFPIFDKHGNTLTWSQNEDGDTLLSVTLKEGQSELHVSFADFHFVANDPSFDLNQSLNLSLVSVNPLDAYGEPLETPLAGLDPVIATGDPDVPYLTPAGNEQVAVAVVATHNNAILASSPYDNFAWNLHALDGMVGITDFQNNETLRFDELLGGDAEGLAALDDLLGNAANHTWLANADGSAGLFVAMDGNGTKITLSIADAVATLSVSYMQGETPYTQNVELQGFDPAAQFGENTDGQAVAHMLHEIIKIGCTG